MSALSLAVSEGHLYTVSILLGRGADVNRRTKVLNLVKTTDPA
jgi:Ankyrin repeat